MFFKMRKVRFKAKILTIGHFGPILLLGCKHKIGKGVSGWPLPLIIHVDTPFENDGHHKETIFDKEEKIIL